MFPESNHKLFIYFPTGSMEDSIGTMLKPNYKKKAFWAASGVIFIIVGSLIFYFFEYKKTQGTLFAFIGLVFCGWFSIVYSVFPAFFDRNKKSAEMVFLKILTCFLCMGALSLNINYVISLEKIREKNILTHSPSAITRAKVISIEMRQLKNGTRRYIHIQYIANGHPVKQEIPDDKAEFELIKSYRLKYSVRYPEMFEIYK